MSAVSQSLLLVTSEHAHTHIPTCARHLHKPSLGVKHSDKKKQTKNETELQCCKVCALIALHSFHGGTRRFSPGKLYALDEQNMFHTVACVRTDLVFLCRQATQNCL